MRRFIDLPTLIYARPEWLQADDRAAVAPPPLPEDDEEDKENMKWTR